MSSRLPISRSLLAVTAFTVLFLGVRRVAYAQTADADRIRLLERRFTDAFRAKDVDGIMANYEHSADLVFFDVVPRPEHRGWDAYRKDWEGLFASIEGPVKLFDISDLEITVNGSVAYGSSFQRSVVRTKAGAWRDMTVRVTDVYRKSGGKWLIVQEHVSVPVDLRTGKPDLQSKP